MSAIFGFLKRFNSGCPVRRVADTTNMNRIANILEGLTGYGCRVEKPTDAHGRGWSIIVDGTSDELLPDGTPGPVGRPGFPWGMIHPWGLAMDGVTPTIAAGDFLAGEGGYISTGKTTLEPISEDQSWIGLRFNPADSTLIVIGPQADKPAPHDGLFEIWIYLFGYTAAVDAVPASAGPPAVAAVPAVPATATLLRHNLTGLYTGLFALPVS